MRRRAGERLSRQARELRAERRQLIGWRYIPATLVYCAFSSLIILYLAWASKPEMAWMFAGFAGGASLLLLYIATDTVSVNRIESAAIAEWNTSSEVRKLHRRGWKVIDNLPFDKFDVDHIAIGPGGVVVLETKWTSDGLTEAKGQLNQYGDRAVRQVSDNVRPINTVLKQYGSGAEVAHSCVVSWGTRSLGGLPCSPGPNVTVLDGDELAAFLSRLDPVLTPAEVDTAFDALNTYLGIRLDHIAKKETTAKAGV